MAYTLSEIAVKSRPFRVITPTATQSGDMARTLMPILQTWRNSAAVSVALYAQGADNEDLKDQDDNTSLEIAALLALLRFRSFFESVETWHRSKWLASVAHATGVDAKWMTEAPQAGNRLYRRTMMSQQGGGVVAAANATPAQAIAANISTAIDNAAASAQAFAKSLSDEAQNRINQALLGGRRTGSPAADVARDINAGLAKARQRAVRGADNEVDNAVKAMTDARMREAGLTLAEWVHTRQQHPRIWHQARDRKVYGVDDSVWAELYLPNCKCSKRPVVE